MQNIINKRFLELDALRGIAVFLVILSHYTWAYDYHFKSLDEHSFHFFHGEFGVQVFFMISGFVIFMTIEKVRSIGEFAISRFSRLYPIYWLCIIITVSIAVLFPIPTIGIYSLKQILINLTMIQGFLKTNHVDQVYWSLGVELVFYLIIGLLYQFKLIKNILFVFVCWLSICLFCLVVNFPYENIIRIVLIIDHAPLFISGILFYKIFEDSPNIKNYTIGLISCYIIYQLNLYDALRFRNQYELTVTPFLLLTSAYVIFYLVVKSKANFLKNKILLFLGAISYPLYLLHNVIGYIIIFNLKKYTNNQAVYFSITAFIVIGLAFIVHRYIEKPVSNALKIKLLSSLTTKPNN